VIGALATRCPALPARPRIIAASLAMSTAAVASVGRSNRGSVAACGWERVAEDGVPLGVATLGLAARSSLVLRRIEQRR